MSKYVQAGILKKLWALSVVTLTFFSFYSSSIWAAGQIGAIGHLTPGSFILDLSGTRNSTISEILVQPDQLVSKGDILVKFSNHDVLKAEYDMAQLSLEDHEKTLKSKIDLQEHKIKSTRIILKRAKADLANYKNLNKQSTSRKEMIRRKRLAEDANLLLTQDGILLRQLNAELELKMRIAKTRVELAQANFRESYLEAPIDGTILEVKKQVGEYLGGDSVIRMADFSKMYVRCEIYEGDLLKVKVGMDAKITSNSLPKEISGKVERVGRVVNASSRLAIVWVLLDQAEDAAKLIGMEVQTTIHF